MPHSRRVEKGSFGGKLDDLLEHSAEQPAKPLRKQPDTSKSPKSEGRSIHDRLFERSWKAAPKKAQPSGFSNQ